LAWPPPQTPLGSLQRSQDPLAGGDLLLRGRRGAEGKGMEVTGGKKGGGSEGMEGKGKWDAGPASRQVPGAQHWQKTGLPAVALS